MSKIGYIARYFLIVKKLQRDRYASFEELNDFIQSEAMYYGEDYSLISGFSKRTLQRDIRELRTAFGFGISYDASRKAYTITEEPPNILNFDAVMEAFYLFNSLANAEERASYVSTESRKPAGVEYLPKLAHAISKKKQIAFDHTSFAKGVETHRVLHPYGLKQAINRWYVVGKQTEGEDIRPYGIDRIKNLEILSDSAEVPADFDLDKYFEHSFGIITADDQAPQRIVLSYTPFQGQFVKSLPLHRSQKILVDDKTELRVELKMHVTHDFVMELLSVGDNVRVLEPQSLIENLRTKLQRAWEFYSIDNQ